jgi:hypothetical protein
VISAKSGLSKTLKDGCFSLTFSQWLLFFLFSEPTVVSEPVFFTASDIRHTGKYGMQSPKASIFTDEIPSLHNKDRDFYTHLIAISICAIQNLNAQTCKSLCDIKMFYLHLAKKFWSPMNEDNCYYPVCPNFSNSQTSLLV